MEFECDGPKSEANREKHGIDFFAAQAIWSDVQRVVVPAKTESDVRGTRRRTFMKAETSTENLIAAKACCRNWIYRRQPAPIRNSAA